MLKAISLWQPWASAMAIGLKKNETRHWPTTHRGELAICASKRMLDQIGLDVARYHNIPIGDAMPFGAVVCVVEIRWCQQVGGGPPFDEVEAALGDYSHGRWIWMTHNLRRLEHPVPVRGRQAIFTLPPDVEEAVRKQLIREIMKR